MAQGGNGFSWEKLWGGGKKAAKNALVGATALGMASAADPEPVQAQPVEAGYAATSNETLACGGREVAIEANQYVWRNFGGDPFASRAERFTRMPLALDKFVEEGVITRPVADRLKAEVEADVNANGAEQGRRFAILPGCTLDAMVYGGVLQDTRTRRPTEVRVETDVVVAPSAGNPQDHREGGIAWARMWEVTEGNERIQLLLSEACNNYAILKQPAEAPVVQAEVERVREPDCAEAVFRPDGLWEPREGNTLSLEYFVIGGRGGTLPPDECTAFINEFDQVDYLPSEACDELHPCNSQVMLDDMEAIIGRRATGELAVLARYEIDNVSARLGTDGELTILEDIRVARGAILAMCITERDSSGRIVRTTNYKFSLPIAGGSYQGEATREYFGGGGRRAGRGQANDAEGSPWVEHRRRDPRSIQR